MFDGRLKELCEGEEYDPKTHPRVEEYYRRLREACEEEEEEDVDTQEDDDLVVGQVSVCRKPYRERGLCGPCDHYWGLVTLVKFEILFLLFGLAGQEVSSLSSDKEIP